jgi:hypothetical protein
LLLLRLVSTSLQCVDLKPDWAKGYSRLGAAYYGLQDWEQAIKAYENGEGQLQVVSLCRALGQQLQLFACVQLQPQAAGVVQLQQASAGGAVPGSCMLQRSLSAQLWRYLQLQGAAVRPYTGKHIRRLLVYRGGGALCQ